MTTIIISRRLALVILVALLVLMPWMARGCWSVGARMIAALHPAGHTSPVDTVQVNHKVVALSFDAGFGAQRTPLLLDILDKYGAKATFFVPSFWVEENPDVAREISARGHELGLHSATHPHMTSLGSEDVRQELLENYRAISEVTGAAPELFRPPFGEYTDRVIETAAAEGFTTVGWSVDAVDERGASPAAIAGRVIESVRPGGILLFHCNGENTPAAVDVVLTRLALDGYEVVPVSLLLGESSRQLGPR